MALKRYSGKYLYVVNNLCYAWQKGFKKKKQTYKEPSQIFSTEPILDCETKGSILNAEHHYPCIPSY